METSNSVGPKTGWIPFYIIFKEKNIVVGIIVSFLKNHSQGEYVFDHSWADAYERSGGKEYVFDHSWADAYERSGGNYYPKLQVAVLSKTTGSGTIYSCFRGKNISTK